MEGSVGFWGLVCVCLVYATREPAKMVRFDWFVISRYWAISRDCDLKLGILFSTRDGRLVTLIKTKKNILKCLLYILEIYIVFTEPLANNC